MYVTAKNTVRLLSAVALAAAASVALSSPATAADPIPVVPPVTPPTPPAPPAPAFDWTGFYVGVSAAWAWGNTFWQQTADNPPTPADDFSIGDSQSWAIGGPIVGGFAGFNYQAGNVVFGIEGGFNWANIAGTATSVHGNADDVMTTRVSSLATIVGRLGFAANDWLFYARGGYAGGNVNASWVDNSGPSQGNWNSSVWHHGWQAGLGIERALSHNIVLGVEYNYTSLLTQPHTGTENPAGGTLTYDVNAAFHSVGVRLSVLVGGP